MAFQITGKIEVIGEKTSIPSKNGGQPFLKQDLVLDCTRFNPDTGEPWENHPRFELTGRNVGQLDNLQLNQKVTVDFALKGAKYADPETGEVKYFTSISAFKVTPVSNQQPQQNYQQGEAPASLQTPVPQAGPVQGQAQGMPQQEDNDDLPF